MTAKELIQSLGLERHPEGGWYRETWRSDVTLGIGKRGRASATAIHFLLEANQSSEWHRVDAAEMWLWHSGDPLVLLTKPQWEDAPAGKTLGADLAAGEQPQLLVPAHHWQSARPTEGGSAGYTLVSCIVSPGFEFSGFELREE